MLAVHKLTDNNGHKSCLWRHVAHVHPCVHTLRDREYLCSQPCIPIYVSTSVQVSITMIATGFGSGVVEASLRPAARQKPQQPPQQQPQPSAFPRQAQVDRQAPAQLHTVLRIIHCFNHAVTALGSLALVTSVTRSIY